MDRRKKILEEKVRQLYNSEKFLEKKMQLKALWLYLQEFTVEEMIPILQQRGNIIQKWITNLLSDPKIKELAALAKDEEQIYKEKEAQQRISTQVLIKNKGSLEKGEGKFGRVLDNVSQKSPLLARLCGVSHAEGNASSAPKSRPKEITVDLVSSELDSYDEEDIITSPTVIFKLPTENSHIESVSDLIWKKTELLPLEDIEKTRLNTTIMEAVDNAKRHGHQFNPEKVITVQYIRSSDRLTVKIQDEGPGFDYKRILLKGMNEESIQAARDRYQEGGYGGLGMHLMVRGVDRLQYNDIGNEVTLIKYLDKSKLKSAAQAIKEDSLPQGENTILETLVKTENNEPEEEVVTGILIDPEVPSYPEEEILPGILIEPETPVSDQETANNSFSNQEVPSPVSEDEAFGFVVTEENILPINSDEAPKEVKKHTTNKAKKGKTKTIKKEKRAQT